MRELLTDRRLSNLTRWHARATVGPPETLAAHAGEVARIAYWVAFELRRLGIRRSLDPERVAVLALHHDDAEVITGDTPSYAKAIFKDARRAFARWERRALPMLFTGAPSELGEHLRGLVTRSGDHSRLEGQVVRYADDVSALSYALGQAALGNSEMGTVAHSLEEICNARSWRWLKRLRGHYEDLP